MNRAALSLSVLLSLALLPTATAHEFYSGGCDECHDSFDASPYESLLDGHAWPDSLHEVHENPIYMGTDCDACHSDALQEEPVRISSSLAGPGCLGCHGHADGDMFSGAGLLHLHYRVGEGQSCQECHDAPDTVPTEDLMPPYYGGPLTLIDSPCDRAEEDWSGDGLGLDNDGDGLYDDNDPDCSSNAGPWFIRGDSNGSLDINISDGIFTLGFLFSGTEGPPCDDAADANDSGTINIADAVYTFGFLFSGSAIPPAPYPDPGSDPTDDELGCDIDVKNP